MSEIISFKVQGSDLYQVDFINTIDKLKIHCSCPAGQNFTVCKHRKNIMNGITDNITSDNKEQVDKVKQWVDLSIFLELFDYLKTLEKDKKRILKKVADTKKHIARYMDHG
ncbi:hypothetical protein [Bathymodiolus septemdierum thioautotrophic gill symbiont]|nr:hypothetical protein [Bathymodiolus septemdierum thioautotrophic gill symbiont]